MTPAAAIRDFILESVAGIRNIPPEVATLQGIALAGVFQIIISEAGRRTREGQSQKKIADELRPIVENITARTCHHRPPRRTSTVTVARSRPPVGSFGEASAPRRALRAL